MSAKVRQQRFDPDALYIALDRQRRHRHVRWRDVAREAGVSASTLTRIGQGRRPDADALLSLLLWLGTTDVGPFISKDGWRGQPEENRST